MTTMTLQVPESIEKEHDKTVRFFAAKLYEAGELSYGQAARMCGHDKWTFAAVLAEFNVDFFQYTYEELQEELEQMRKL
jgi:predicted HTH domain antitoxin